MCEAFTKKWKINQDFSGATTSKASSMHMLTESCRTFGAMCSTQGRCREHCTPVTCFHRVLFMGMMNEMEVSPKVHCSDEVNPRSAAILRDYAGRFRPRYRIFVRPGSEKSWHFDRWDKLGNPEGNWDLQASHITDIHTESGHPSIPGATIFEQGTLLQKRR